MKIQIQSIHFDADNKLIEFIQKKVSKLEKFYDHMVDGSVFLRIAKDATQENKISEIKIQIPGNTLYSKHQCKTFEEATDLSVESLRNQIRKFRGKFIDNKRSNHKVVLEEV